MKDDRAFDPVKAQEQAEILYNAGIFQKNVFLNKNSIRTKPFLLLNIGEGKIGTDEAAFVEILAHAGQRQAYLIFEEYKKLSGKTIEQAMTSEMSGELLNGLLAMGIIQQLGKKSFYSFIFTME